MHHTRRYFRAETGAAVPGDGTDTTATWPSYVLLSVRASLRVGKDLYDTAHKQDALSHFRLICEALDGDFGRVLRGQGLDITSVQSGATALHLAVSTGAPAEEVSAIYSDLGNAISEIAAGAEAVADPDPDRTSTLIATLLDQAAEAYAAACAGGGSADVLGYQCARGLVWTARDMLSQTAGELAARDQDRFTALTREFGRLQSVWASLTPPEQPTSPGRVRAQVSKIEFNMNGFPIN